jgi:hypothetical protein
MKQIYITLLLLVATAFSVTAQNDGLLSGRLTATFVGERIDENGDAAGLTPRGFFLTVDQLDLAPGVTGIYTLSDIGALFGFAEPTGIESDGHNCGPLMFNSFSGYGISFHFEPVPADEQIRFAMGVCTARDKNFDFSTCMQVRLTDVEPVTETFSGNDPRLTATPWRLVEYIDKTTGDAIDLPKEFSDCVVLMFGDDNTVSLPNGCNITSGRFEAYPSMAAVYPAEGRISFYDFLPYTKLGCGDFNDFEDDYINSLRSATTYYYYNDDQFVIDSPTRSLHFESTNLIDGVETIAIQDFPVEGEGWAFDLPQAYTV